MSTTAAYEVTDHIDWREARTYAMRGWHVLPTDANTKAPRTDLVRRGHLDATLDLDQARHWWPDTGAGIGIACAASGLVVVDVDTDDLDPELERMLASCPYQVLTARGRHYYYLARPGARYVGKLTTGVDVKHQGYVVAAPSQHPTGAYYQVRAHDLPGRPPADLEQLLLSRRQP